MVSKKKRLADRKSLFYYTVMNFNLTPKPNCEKDILLTIAALEYGRSIAFADLVKQVQERNSYSVNKIHATCGTLLEQGFIKATAKTNIVDHAPIIVRISGLTQKGQEHLNEITMPLWKKEIQWFKKIASQFLVDVVGRFI